MVHLPFEIVLRVIDALVDFGPTVPVALHPSDWRRRQLQQWLLVSKATNAVATRYLYSHCMYIDSQRTLMLLVRTVSPPDKRNGDEDGGAASSCKYLSYITSMYLAPLSSKLDDLPAAIWIFELLCLVSPYLKRLTFDLPFGSLSVSHDHLGVYRYLRDGLARLERLEELVYMRDIWHLAEGWTIDNPLFWWSRFRGLKKLAIPWPTWPDWCKLFLSILQRALPDLQHLIVLRTLPKLQQVHASHIDCFLKIDRPYTLKVVQLYAESDVGAEEMQSHHPLVERGANVELHSLPGLTADEDNFENSRLDVADFALAAAVEGTLWHLPTIPNHV
ncbi:uncharacterized protein PV09_09504 [Verruconis gallopava]|uniref:F-box domain-containing protein n=1 Tax=Verruconis gallopava TaxID=253628 RepID=A0A0D1ZW54_9PEZI|nr:uncharacterized protein PV09_09504 [Verruconis gallopava]KIV98717.1 hypothetical protein PV09_09504 [Verruconis gallopava]